MLVLAVRLNSKRMIFICFWEGLLGVVLRGVTVYNEKLKGKPL